MAEDMKALSKGEIFSRDDRTRERVEVPEWGGVVYVQAMSAVERHAYITRYQQERDHPEMAVPLLVQILILSVVDEAGQRIFDVEDLAVLQERSALVIARLTEVAMRVNGLSRQSRESMQGN